MKATVISAAVLLLASSAAFAATGTCADPIPLTSNADITGATTCGGEVGINMGGAVLPHFSKVYSFTYHANSDNPDQLRVSGTDMNVIIAPSCTAAPVGGGISGTPFNLSGLTDGSSYVAAVTTDPSIAVPAAGPVCGGYGLQSDTLPVKLQNFSVK